jgi:hypothetical protein
MHKWLIHIAFCCFAMGHVSLLHGQDSTTRARYKKLSLRNMANDVYHNFLVVGKQTDDSVFFQKSEQSFQPYAGKVIRRVLVRNLSFGENVLDTSRSIISTITRVADNLQSNTKDYIIKQLLFVRKGQLVDPYRLADNERFLRDQDFIKDARIIVRMVPGNNDSVDVYVRVRDVFSWGAEVQASGISDFQLSLYDANLFGRAQRLQYSILYDRGRHPAFGSEIQYRKTSIAGTFINLEAAYTGINRGISLGEENERAYYLKLDRPLYTPNARVAGGLEISENNSNNAFNKPDSLYREYRYRLGDIWAGYNIGVQQQRDYKEDNRRRQFVALRYFNQHFLTKPLLESFDARYTNKEYLLGQYTWYKINFYRTNYIYGFGRTEDLPVGMMRKITTGPVRVDSLRRWYAGWEFNHWLVDKQMNYWSYTIALGTNIYQKQWQDNSAFFNMSWFSRLYSFRKFKLRQFANINYAGIFNHHVYEPLYIDNNYGLDDFRTDSVKGLQRVTAGTETTMYTRWQILGFKIGFFAFGRASLISPTQDNLLKGHFYPSIGGGVRTRNENLIFGTIELRFTWFPRTAYDVNNISLNISSNLRLKFTGSFVQAPWFSLVR